LKFRYANIQKASYIKLGVKLKFSGGWYLLFPVFFKFNHFSFRFLTFVLKIPLT